MVYTVHDSVLFLLIQSCIYIYGDDDSDRVQNFITCMALKFMYLCAPGKRKI